MGHERHRRAALGVARRLGCRNADRIAARPVRAGSFSASSRHAEAGECVVIGVTSAARLAPARWLSLRLALRELRGGVRGFGVFIACIALGVAAIAGVGSFAQGLVDGLAREGRAILGGDLSFSLIQREATPDERAFLRGLGDVSVAATLRAMARTADGRSTLVEIKAVDG